MKGGKQLKKSRIDSACGEAVLQCGFDYMSKIHKPKRKKKEKKLVSGIFRLLIDLRILVKAIMCNQL